MKPQLYAYELKSLQRSTVIWALCLTGLSIGFLCLYPLFAKDISTAKEVLDKFPPTFKELFNIAADRFATVLGFFSYLFNFILLAGSIQALHLGLRELSQEEADKTVDFLLSKPISRAEIITSKLLAALTSLVIVNVVFIAGSFIAARAVSEAPFDTGVFLLIAGSLFLVQLLFLGLGFVLAATLKRIKSVVSFSMPIVFAFFILGALGSAIGNVDISRLTPFKYFDTGYVLDHSSYDIKYVLVTVVLLSLATVFTYTIYRKRDIRSV